jgi:hypothetical protein
VTGVTVTKYINALARSICDVTRTVIVWIVGIIITVSAGVNKPNYKWELIDGAAIAIQLFGFFVLIAGNLIYNKILRIPFLMPKEESSTNRLIRPAARRGRRGEEGPLCAYIKLIMYQSTHITNFTMSISNAIGEKSLGDAGQFEGGLVLFLGVFLDLGDSSRQHQSFVPGLPFRDHVGGDGNVVDLVLGDDVELVSELADDFGGGLDDHYHFPGHAHGDLRDMRLTGPISLSWTFTWTLLGRLRVMRCEITSSFFISILS